MDRSGVYYLWITVTVFISCLDSHSDGTHSLQRVHWWTSDVISPNLLQWGNKLILNGLRVSTFLANLNFWVNYSFNAVQPHCQQCMPYVCLTKHKDILPSLQTAFPVLHKSKDRQERVESSGGRKCRITPHFLSLFSMSRQIEEWKETKLTQTHKEAGYF